MTQPKDEIRAERDALRNELSNKRTAGHGPHVLTYYGNEELVAVVDREKSPPTEHTNAGEQVVLIEWHGGEDYALSVAKGTFNGWEMQNELVSSHDNRTEAVTATADLLKDE